MFSKSKITQSMIDAVNTVVGLTEKVDAKKRTEETDKGESSTDAKGNKTTKYKDGSWQTETPTHKDDGKNPEGKVHHLSDVARRKMIKMNANNEEVELDEVLDTRKSIKSYLDKNDAQRTTLKASGTFDKVKKRLTGANKALDKLSKLNREEVLDERDEGKPGKMFKVIAAKAAEKYGSKEAGARVAGAIRKKVLAKEEIEYNGYGKEVKTPKMVGMHFYNVPKEKEADAKRWGLKQTKSGKWGKTKYDTSGASHNDDVRRTDMQFGKSTYWEPKKVSESIEFLELDEMNVGKKQPRPDTHHIVDKENKPLSLAAYYDKTKAEKDRDEKHPGSKVITRGPRGKVKEEVELEEKLNIQNTSMGDIIKDFQTSDAPQFAGKSQAKRRQMAIAAKMATEEYLDEDSDDKFASDAYSTTRGKVVKNKSGVFFVTNKSGSTKSFTSEKQANRHAMKEEYLDEENAVDKVTMDVPLLIRIMEYSKEDAKSDMDLHKVAENLVEYSKSGKTLTMACYDEIVGGITEAKRPEDDSVPFITNEAGLSGHVNSIKNLAKHTFKKLKAHEEVELEEATKVVDRVTGKEYDPEEEMHKFLHHPKTVAAFKRMKAERGRGWPKSKAHGDNEVKESYYDDDPDVARADRELARMKAKPIKADRKTNPEKEMSKLSKRAPKEDTDELDKDLTHKEEFNLGESSHTERKKSFIGMLDRISAKAKENTKLQQNRKIEPKLPKKDLEESEKPTTAHFTDPKGIKRKQPNDPFYPEYDKHEQGKPSDAKKARFAKLGLKAEEVIYEAKKDSYQIYHPTYSSAVQHAEKHLNKQGFDIHPDDWFHHVNSGPSKPAEGKTVSLHIPLHKDGVPSKKVAHIQVYNRGNDLANNHELNMYHN